MKVHEAMTVDVLTVTPESTLKEAAVRMATHGISGMPVVDDNLYVVGVISEADVLAKEATASRAGGMFRWLLDPDPTWSSRAEAITVEDAMSAPPLTTTPNRSVAAAATAMLDEGVNRLPVVDEEGVLVGLISRGDLVRAFARGDDEIRHEIEEDVIRRALWLAPSLEVTVEAGAVKVEGEVESAAEAALVPSFIRRVPGVVSVDSELTYRNP